MMHAALSYLATPYSKYKHGIWPAHTEACAIAARLLAAGYPIYSPIAHSHSLAIWGRLDPLDHSIWLPMDEIMMARCDQLLVAHMDGWEESYGVKHEINFFLKMGKPIFDLELISLKMTRRA